MNFLNIHRKLKEYSDRKFSISFHYHEDVEPLLIMESDVERITLDLFVDTGFSLSIFTKENLISFHENQWIPNMGEDYVTFGSKVDDKVHWIIEFC